MAGPIVDAVRMLDDGNTGLVPLKMLTSVFRKLSDKWDDEKVELLVNAAGVLSEGNMVRYEEWVSWLLHSSATPGLCLSEAPVRKRTKTTARVELREPDRPLGSVTLRILHINDVYDLTPLPRVRTAIESLRGVPGVRTISTMGGDFLAPYLLSSLDKGAGMLDCMNNMPISHCCFGNHECDVPHASLLKAIDNFKGTWINSNMKGGGFGELDRLPEHAVLDLVSQDRSHRRRVALLGLLTGDTHLYRTGVFNGAVPSIEPVNECCARLCTQLTGAGGCDAVVPMTHQDSSQDVVLAARGRELGVPLILGGHDHLEIVAAAPNDECCTYMKAGMDAMKIGFADITWETPETQWPTVEAKLLDTMEFECEPELQTLVEMHMAKVWALEHMVACRRADMEELTPPGTNFPLSSIGTRLGESSMATFLCTALKDALRCDVCLLDGGSVRAGCDKYLDKVTMSDLKAEMPFKNDTLVVRLPGSVLSEAVRTSRCKAADKPYAFFLHCDRDCIVEASTHHMLTAAGEPLDLERVYSVAVGIDLGIGSGVNEPLMEWANTSVGNLPEPEMARPALELLEIYFVRRLWRLLPTFDEIDTQGDGLLCRHEIKQAYVKAFTGAGDLDEAQKMAVEEMVGHLIRVLDFDGDQKISPDDYAELVMEGKPVLDCCSPKRAPTSKPIRARVH